MMRYYKTQSLLIKAGEQASVPIGISPMTSAHAIFGPKTGDSMPMCSAFPTIITSGARWMG